MTLRWMSTIDGQRPISLINIPGTHNSTTRYIPFRYLCRCQDKSITRQLELGVRYLDLRVELYKGGLKLVHSIIDCRPGPLSFKKLRLEDIMEECACFVRENASETVIMNFQTDDGKKLTETSDALYEKYILPYQGLWFTENRIPYLDECRGKLILARRSHPPGKVVLDDKNSGINFFKSQGELKNQRLIRSLESGEILFEAYIQDDYFVPPKKKWYDFVLPCLNNQRASDTSILINHLSANNGLNSPKITARYVNKRFLLYQLKKGESYGIICADYITKQISRKIISSNAQPENSNGTN